MMYEACSRHTQGKGDCALRAVLIQHGVKRDDEMLRIWREISNSSNPVAESARKQNKKLEVKSATGQKSEHKVRQKNIQVLKVDGAETM